ncbi:MAG: flippase [Candidatus Diapherotrites archaeon]
MSTAARIAKNTFFLASGQIAWLFLSLLLLAVAGRQLGVDDFGKYAFAFSFAAIFLAFTEMGFGQLIVRDVAREKSLTEKYLGNIFSAKLLLGLAAFALAALLVNLLGYPADTKTAVYLLSAYTVLSSLAGLAKNVFRAHEKMKYESAITVSAKTLNVALGVAALFLGYGLIGLCLAFLLSGAFEFIASFFLLSWKISRFRPEIDFVFWRRIFSDAAAFVAIAFIASLYGSANQLLLSFFNGDTATGIFGAAFKLIEGFEMLPWLFIAAVFPALSLFFSSSRELLQKTYSKAFKLLFMIGLPFAVGVTLTSDKIISLVFGTEFIGAATVLTILAWASLLKTLNSLDVSLLFAANQQKKVLGFAAASALIALAVQLAFIKESFFGAAGALIAAVFFGFTANHLNARKICRTGENAFILKSCIAAIAMALFLLFFAWIEVIALIVFAAAIYFAALLLLKGISTEEIGMARKAIGLN